MFTLFKYLVWLVVSLACLMLATITISEFLVAHAVHAPYDEQLADYASVLAREVRADGDALQIRAGAVELLRSDRRDRMYFALRDREGDVVMGESRMPAVAGALAPGVPALANGQIGDEPVRVAALQIADPRQAEAALTVQVAETLNKRQALTEALRTQAVALPQLLVLVVAILLIVYGYTFVLRPMQRLRTLIDNRGSTDLSPLDPDAAPHDLRPLILAINGLMRRLEASVLSQQRFIADAAHQLRTPLAGIKSQTERALVERDPQAVRAALARVAAGTEHATALANRLLTLARAETPSTTPPAAVDLVGVVRDTVAEQLPQALARGHDLGFDGPPGDPACVVHGDALLLRELLSNLVDNALRYTPDGGAVTVSLRRDADACTLAVSDTGLGIAADERERVFEPFYRGPDVTAPGTGLGLPIVRAIAQAHHASVALAAAADGGLLVVVRFPTAAAS